MHRFFLCSMYSKFQPYFVKFDCLQNPRISRTSSPEKRIGLNEECFHILQVYTIARIQSNFSSIQAEYSDIENRFLDAHEASNIVLWDESARRHPETLGRDATLVATHKLNQFSCCIAITLNTGVLNSYSYYKANNEEFK